jgi:hypothetical protein
MPIINSSLGFLGVGTSKEDATAAAGAAIEMWTLAKVKFDGVKVYCESGYGAFLDAQLKKAQDLLVKVQKSTKGVTFFGPLAEDAANSLAIAKAVVEQFKQVSDAVLAGRPPMRGSVKVPVIGGEGAFVLGPGAAIAVALVGGALILFATYKGARAVKARFRSR